MFAFQLTNIFNVYCFRTGENTVKGLGFFFSWKPYDLLACIVNSDLLLENR